MVTSIFKGENSLREQTSKEKVLKQIIIAKYH